MKQIIRLILLLLLQICNQGLYAQQKPPFFREIEEFKHQDSISPPPKGAILFIGSSSIRGWRDIQSYFPEFKIINRGFGGSSLPHVIRYAPDIIYPYKPSQVVIYAGENDFPSSESVTADTVFNRFTQLFTIIRAELPKTPVLFISIKPSPSRLKYMPEMVRANKMIRKYLQKKTNAEFADVYSKMLLRDGSPMPEIFKADRLHMNEKGYAIWQKVIRPYLKR
jgi:lysophospholipase L1-like esterase